MPTISTTARRLRAYQATLDRLARPARPTTASRRCAPAGDGTLHALLTVSAYFTLAYIYVVIGSIDLLTSSEVPRTMYSNSNQGNFGSYSSNPQFAPNQYAQNLTGPALSGIWLPCRQASGLKAGTSVRQDAPCKGHGHVVLLLARAFFSAHQCSSFPILEEIDRAPLAAAQQLGALTEALQKQAEDMKIVKSALQL